MTRMAGLRIQRGHCARCGQHAVAADLARYVPYVADDSDGVHFQVCVDATYVNAHAGWQMLARSFGIVARDCDWIAVYWKHRSVIDACVVRRVRQDGFWTVILRLDELAARALEGELKDQPTRP